MIGNRIKRILLIGLSLILMMSVMAPAIAEEGDGPDDIIEAFGTAAMPDENAVSSAEGDVVYIDDGVIRVTVDLDMNIHVYRHDSGGLTLMAGPVEKMDEAGATALTGAPWANDIPWSSAAGGTSGLVANSAKLLSLKSGYVTTWSQGGTGTNADRLTHGNAQFEQLPMGGDDFVRTGAVYESGVETWIGLGNRLTITAVNNTLNLTRKIVLETADDLPGEVAYSTYYTYVGEEDSYKVTKFVESNLMIKEPVKPTKLTIDGYDRIDAGLWVLYGSPTAWGHDYLKPVFYDMGAGAAVNFNQTGNTSGSPGTNARLSMNCWNWGADAGIPLNAFYGTTIGLSVGSLMPYNTYGLEMPMRGSGIGATENSRNNEIAYTWMGWPGKTLVKGDETFVGTSLLAVHDGDFYEGAGLFRKAMDNISATAMVTSGLDASDVGLCKLSTADELPDYIYGPSFETIGYVFDFLPENMINHLPEFKQLGMTSITLDAGWYPRSATEGEGIYLPAVTRSPNSWTSWVPVAQKLADIPVSEGGTGEPALPCTTPLEAVKVVKAFNDYFHFHDMMVIAWVMTPNGRTTGPMIDEHPNWYARNADGTTKSADGTGFRTLCTANPEVLEEYTDYFVDIIFNQMGFDGIKGDSFYGVSPCYGADGKGNGHGHDGDIYANIKLYGKFFKTIYDKACLARGATETLGGPIVDREMIPTMKNCMCGQPMDYFTWAGTNRPVPGDHVGSRTERYLVKMYKGFYGDNYMVDTDQNHLSTLRTTGEAQRPGPIDFVSYIGVGGAISSKYSTDRFDPPPTALAAYQTQRTRYPGDPDYTATTGTAQVYKWGDAVKWYGLSKDLALSSRDTYMLNLYKYGLDYPEGYAFKQGNDFFFSFYATNNSVSSLKTAVTVDPWGNGYVSANTYDGSIELRGLKAGARYYVTNVENGKQYEGTANADGKITLSDIHFITGVIYKVSEIHTTSIYGTVTGINGVIIAGAELELLTPDGNPVTGISRTAADLDGFYCFPIVPAGEYVILATAYKDAFGTPYPRVTIEDTLENISIPFKVTAGEYEKNIDITEQRFEVYYNANGGAGATTKQYVIAGKQFKTYPASYYKWAGHEFVEWNTKANGSGDIYLADKEYIASEENMQLYAMWRWAVPSASVKKLNGNQNELTITVTEHYTNGKKIDIVLVIMINNNAAATYKVGRYSVYVDTKGNTQIRACEIVAVAAP